MTALKHDEMVAAVKAGYIALEHTLGAGQDAGFKQGGRKQHREVLATMYDNLIVFHRPAPQNAKDGRWTQERLDGSVIVHEVITVGCLRCPWESIAWSDEGELRISRHGMQCPGDGSISIAEFAANVEAAHAASQVGTADE